jgi:hypothetical protein
MNKCQICDENESILFKMGGYCDLHHRRSNPVYRAIIKKKRKNRQNNLPKCKVEGCINKSKTVGNPICYRHAKYGENICSIQRCSRDKYFPLDICLTHVFTNDKLFLNQNFTDFELENALWVIPDLHTKEVDTKEVDGETDHS